MARNSTWDRAVLFAVVLLVLAFLYRIRTVLIPFVLAAALAYLLAPGVAWLHCKGLPRSVAILVCYMVLGGLVAAALWLFLPRLIRELEGLAESYPRLLMKADQWLDSMAARFATDQLPIRRGTLDEVVARLQEVAFRGVEAVLASVPGVVQLLLAFLLAPLLSFYVLRDGDRLWNAALRELPASWRQPAAKAAEQTNRVLHGYLRGQLAVAAVMGALSATGLALLGVPFAVVLGTLAGMAEIIPYFGPFIGAILPLLFALAESPWLALKVLVFFVAIHQLESSLISPYLVGARVGMHPLAVIFAVLAGGRLAGPWGLLLGVPVAAVLAALYRLMRPGEGNHQSRVA